MRKKQRINGNTFADEVTIDEGLIDSVDGAQIREVLRVTFGKLANDYTLKALAAHLRKYRKK